MNHDYKFLTKVKMTKSIYLLAAFLFILNSIHGQIELHIASDGHDLNPGTEEQPLASLIGARNFIRNHKRNHKVSSSYIVNIDKGNYEMNEPLILTPEDRGSEKYPIIYRAKTGTNPIFSGGKRITGFKINENGIWETKIPESIYYRWRFDQLYVNGKRATMARTPNKGFLKIKQVKENIWEKGSGRAPEKSQQIFSFDVQNFKSINKITEDEVDLIRFRAYHKWDFTLRFIDKIEKDSSQIYTSGQGMKPWNPIKEGGRIVFENYAAALDAPGEWYLNNTGTLFYKPFPDETPENSIIIAPALENLISIEGDATNNKFVEHIRFEGINFKYCHYRIPRTGSEPNQAAVLINAAVMLKGARNITFLNCEISKTGQHALWFGKGCSDSKVEHCNLNDLGGGGIYLGDVKALEGIEHTNNIQIDNNIIQSGGKEFPSAVGVWVGHSSDNEITHNDISDFYYTGISVGWIWGYAPSLAKRNKIIYNNIHHIGWALLSDMAAVYTLGESTGTVINNNVIHHVHAYSYGGWGLYPDEGTSNITMENNLVYSTKTGGFHQHYGENNSIKNNIFAFAKLYQVQCTRVEKHRSFNFENNIVIFNQGVVLKGAWNKIDIVMDQNLYWNIGGDKYDFNGKSFSKWKRSGHDLHSYIADPYFRDARSYDFTFENEKNIQLIGFKPFDYSKAGVYGSTEWKDKAKLAESVLNNFDKVIEENMLKNR